SAAAPAKIDFSVSRIDIGLLEMGFSANCCRFGSAPLLRDGATKRSGRARPGHALRLLAERSRRLVVPEQRQENDDRNRHSQQPQQYSSTKTHICLQMSLSPDVPPAPISDAPALADPFSGPL